MLKHTLKQFISKATVMTTLLAIFTSFSNFANATIIQIQTSKGEIEVNLFDKTTPKTVDNFLGYISDNAYDDTIVHRSIAGFITQSGGYSFNAEDNLVEVTEKPT